MRILCTHSRWAVALCTAIVVVVQGCGGKFSETGTATDADSVVGSVTKPSFVADAFRKDLSEAEPVDGVLTSTFKITNVGSGVLSLSGVRSSCACARIALSSSDVPPNQSAVLSVTIGREKSDMGSASVQLNTNDAKIPRAVFSLKWNPAKFGLAFQPRRVDFGKVLPQSKTCRVVEVRGDLSNRFCGEIVAQSAQPDGSDLHTEFEREGNIVAVQLEAGTIIGPGKGLLSAVEEDGKRLANCALEWEVAPVIEVVPNALYLGTCTPGHECLGEVRLQHYQDVVPRIENIVVTPEGAEVDATVKGGQGMLQVRIVAPERVGVLRWDVSMDCICFEEVYRVEFPIFVVVDSR